MLRRLSHPIGPDGHPFAPIPSAESLTILKAHRPSSPGGLDSATCLLIALAEGFEVYALSFDYGQRHAIELDRARTLARFYGAQEHRVARIDLPSPGPRRLTDSSQPVPRHSLGRDPIPVTYVPARNTLFLSHALAWAEAIGASTVFIGANALDYSGYPDCRPEFLEAFESDGQPRHARRGRGHDGLRDSRTAAPR